MDMVKPLKGDLVVVVTRGRNIYTKSQYTHIHTHTLKHKHEQDKACRVPYVSWSLQVHVKSPILVKKFLIIVTWLWSHLLYKFLTNLRYQNLYV